MSNVADALKKLADDWQWKVWASAPRRADRIEERLTNAQYVTDWLRGHANLAAQEPPCMPVARQDGYDDGLVLECRKHNVFEPIIENGHQVYEVTLETLEKLVTEHRARYTTTPAEITPVQNAGPE